MHHKAQHTEGMGTPAQLEAEGEYSEFLERFEALCHEHAMPQKKVLALLALMEKES